MAVTVTSDDRRKDFEKWLLKKHNSFEVAACLADLDAILMRSPFDVDDSFGIAMLIRDQHSLALNVPVYSLSLYYTYLMSQEFREKKEEA